MNACGRLAASAKNNKTPGRRRRRSSSGSSSRNTSSDGDGDGSGNNVGPGRQTGVPNTLRERERENETEHWSSRRCGVGKGAKTNTDKVLCLGATLLPLLLSRILLAYLFILIHHTHRHTQTHMLVIVSECTHVRMFYLFSFYSTRIRAGKARHKKKENIIAKYLLYFFYSKQKQSKNKKKVKKRN